MAEKGKSQRQREEDAAFNRMLLWLAGAVAVELLILLLKRIYVDFWPDVEAAYALGEFFRVFRIVGAVLTAAGAVWLVILLRQKKRWRTAAALTGAVAGLWVVSLLAYQLYELGIRILMVLPGAAAVLILIFFLYQRVFFVNAALTGGGIAALWLFRAYHASHPAAVLICFMIGWAALAAAAALAWKLNRTDGRLGPIRFMPAGSTYRAVYLTCGLTAAAMALSLLLGEMAAFYLLFVLVAWLFGQAVYFTVKLM